jgi:RND family efflux transporter MFP subunit
MRSRTGLVSLAHCLAAVSLSGLSASVWSKGFECLIEANQTVEIRSPVEGLIAQILVDRGDSVKRGQLLVELQSDLERANLEAAKYRITMIGRVTSAQSRVEYTSKKFERAQELHAERVAPEQVLDDARAEKRLAAAEYKDALENQELARLEFRRAQEHLNLRLLRSPFDGYVVERFSHPGDLAEAGSARKAILKIAQINPLRVEVVLPQSLFGQVRKGARASVRPEGFQKPYEATVLVVDKGIDAASATFGVRLSLSNPAGEIPSGLRCGIEFPGLATAR